MFKKILIANRGEIACRVIATARKMGIQTVAVYSEADKEARHVRLADEAVLLGPAPSRESYLVADKIIEAAKATGAEAIHPGYGFLSENEAFAERCEKEGIAFIGPKAHSIAAMGDKIASKKLANEAKVNTIPGYNDPIPSAEQAVEIAKGIGYPVMIKASAGGGGKGMSIVRDADGLIPAARLAASEAQRYFNDGRIYAELYVERPRHIEVQILGDGENGAIHLHERECSIQRRFQKIVEEAPSAALPPELAAEICAAAVRLAQAASYRNAGTVEFILAPDGRFYFLEMNTRLQVEHPVTEMISGLDLVAAQVNIAAGRGLPIRQDQLRRDGHAIECRICAEDPERDFMPETGRIRLLRAPQAPWLRFESGLTEGEAVTSDFDPMLAKLVVHGASREQAVERTLEALRGLTLLGVTTNIDYLARVIDSQAFRAGDLHTGFVAQHAQALAPAPMTDDALVPVLVAAALGFREFRQAVFDVPELHAAIGPWRN